MALSSRLLPGHLPTPASLLLLVPLLLGVSPVQISRLTAAARDGGEARYEGGDGGEARYDGGARPVPAWPHPYWDIPGEYCKAEYPSGQCCPGRQDRCSVPILGTLCYCDTFCNRTQNADCCPDYFPHCLGMGRQQFEALEPPRPQSISRPRDCRHGVLNITNPMCEYKGVSYSDRDTILDNCNTCSCQVSKTKPGCMEVLCSTSQCLVEGEVVEELREGEGRGLYNWRPANYTQFWGKSLEEGVRGKLGALRPHAMLQHMSAIQFSYSPASLPTQFDSRKEWPGLVSPVRDQGWCSSSWALATAQVAGDRVSIGKGRLVELSPQTLLSCDTAPQAGCRGGHVDRAWGFLRHHGVWPDRCLPYSSEAGEVGVCPAQSSCIGQEVHMQPAYRVGREDTSQQPRRREQDIMHEIKINGPVQAVMEVYTDFFMYSSGVYSPTNLARATIAGYHAVRILGWGQEGGQRHWLVANSWGDQWGEGGLFRLQRGENTCQIEEFVLGSWPQERKTGGRRRRRRRHRGSQGIRRTRHGRRPHRDQGRERSKARKHYFQVG